MTDATSARTRTVTWQDPMTTAAAARGRSGIEFLEAIRPDFVIADAKIATTKQVERELYRALDERAPYELIVRHKNYGDVAIYRLSWD